MVETPGRCDADGIRPLPCPRCRHMHGLVRVLANTSTRCAEAPGPAPRDAIRALAAHPLVRSVDLAEHLYAEMATAHRAHLPERLLPV